ncbi:polyribonucleotide nucleotidyltransferase [Candidatus Daviesbacteria bacterium]|nr:polyribonucleotide nucleotidyltransferase [Candidatus Daviesbacteria bacterium]
MSNIITKEIDLNGRTLKLETGKLALQANSSVVASWGETVVLVTVSTQPSPEAIAYFPLSVEFVEKHYAGGRISSSKFIKRESRPSDEAILTGRLIDRSIRPLFPKDFHQEVQVIVTVLSIDQANDPDILGLIGTSAALSISAIPWQGPLGGARVGVSDGTLVVNPTIQEAEHLQLDVFAASTKDKVVMVEAGGKEVPDEKVFEAIKKAHQESQAIIGLIEEFTKKVGKEKLTYSSLAEEVEEAILEEVKTIAREKIEAALFDSEHPWHEATGEIIKTELAIKYAEVLTPQIVSGVFDKVAKEIMNDAILKQGKRVDGRAMDEIRPISIEVGVLPRTHGSALFQRGDTQVLSVVTLAAPSLSQTIEGMTGEEQKRFMHHYNMSINPFATGEVKRIGAPNRRDIGHGALVEKALKEVMPSEESFPYAIRVVSEVLAANASTSMASLCASTLALLNAGVPIKEPVAGVAMGLLSDEQKFQVITDMRAVEDFYGEMDFKVAGTKDGITVIQMDTKLAGLSFEIIQQALDQGKKARLLILDKINQAVPSVGQLSPLAPRVEIIHIKPEDIGSLIGPGGKNINSIIAKTKAAIDIEDDGTVMVSSSNEESINKAMAAIKGMFQEIKVGEEFMGKVVRLAPFGAFVEILPGKDGLVHISQMAPGHVEKAEDIVSEGQEVKVRVTEVSPDGKVGLSMLFGDDVKPEREGSPRFAGGAGRPSGRSRGLEGARGGFGNRPRFGGERPGFDRRRPGGFRARGPRTGGFNRGGRGGFNR